MSSLLIRNGIVVTMNPGREVLDANIYIEDGKIIEIPSTKKRADHIIDASNKVVIPGLIQVHVHLNQTLFRGVADDLDVVDWLRLWIWPLESAHTQESVYASARLSIAEMIKGGTTAAMTLETIKHTEAAFKAAGEMGFRATIGNALMDLWEPGTEMIGEELDVALNRSQDLLDRYHLTCSRRLRYAFCPRGTRNISDLMWQEVAKLAKQHNTLLHTHAAENKEHTDRLEKQFGERDIVYLDKMGALGSNLVIAHGVWLTAVERQLLGRAGASVAHCPSANLKLASGFAAVPDMLSDGINIAIGCDGAPCNNNLDAFLEMRLAALIHKPRYGPKVLPAEEILGLMTNGGAKALGLENQIGSLEAGKRADITILKRDKLHMSPANAGDVMRQVVYAHKAADVDTVIIDGEILMQDRIFVNFDEEEIIQDARRNFTEISRGVI